MVHSGVRECETRLPDLMSRRVAADIRGYAVSVRAFARARARALGRVICDVSGPIGCHLSSRCRRVPPLPPALPRFSPLSLSLIRFPLLPFILLPPSCSSCVQLSPSPPPDATLGRNPIRAASLPPASILARVPSRFNPRDRPLPPVLHSSHPLRPFPRRDFLPSSAPTLARFLLLIVPASILNPLSFHLALFSGYANGVISALFSRSISNFSQESRRT